MAWIYYGRKLKLRGQLIAKMRTSSRQKKSQTACLRKSFRTFQKRERDWRHAPWMWDSCSAKVLYVLMSQKKVQQNKKQLFERWHQKPRSVEPEGANLLRVTLWRRVLWFKQEMRAQIGAKITEHPCRLWHYGFIYTAGKTSLLKG